LDGGVGIHWLERNEEQCRENLGSEKEKIIPLRIIRSISNRNPDERRFRLLLTDGLFEHQEGALRWLPNTIHALDSICVAPLGAVPDLDNNLYTSSGHLIGPIFS
jgi:hypothetical protein